MQLKLIYLFISFFKSNPIASILSIIFILFFVSLTIIFPKYLGFFIENIPKMTNFNFKHKVFKLILIYVLLWAGVVIHYLITHLFLLNKSRSFFFKFLNNFIWDKIVNENKQIKNINKLIKNIDNLVITSTQTIQGLVFITLPLTISLVAFIYFLPNDNLIRIFFILIFIILSFSLKFFSSKIEKESQIRQKNTINISNILEQNLINKLNLHNFNLYNQINDELNFSFKKQEKVCFNNGKIQIILISLILLILIISLIYSCYHYIKNYNIYQSKSYIIALLPMITSLFIIIFSNLNRIISFMQTLGDQHGNVKEINKQLDINEVKKEDDNNPALNNSSILPKNIDNILYIENLSFKYNDMVFIFNNLNLNLGFDLHLISANSGRGKTTLFNLIFGNYITFKGNIYFNKQYLKLNNLHQWREPIFYLQQNNTFFYMKTIHENIYYGLDKLETEKLNLLIKKFKLESFINKIINLDNINKLSGGQKQVISILRAFSKYKKQIYLLDEPCSALDLNMKNIIYQMINSFRKEKIILIITHDEDIKKFNPNIIYL